MSKIKTYSETHLDHYFSESRALKLEEAASGGVQEKKAHF